MINFEDLMIRHGECGVQAILERVERYEGIHFHSALSLEERWELLILGQQPQQLAA